MCPLHVCVLQFKNRRVVYRVMSCVRASYKTLLQNKGHKQKLIPETLMENDTTM